MCPTAKFIDIAYKRCKDKDSYAQFRATYYNELEKKKNKKLAITGYKRLRINGPVADDFDDS